jgi:hypothetical protein
LQAFPIDSTANSGGLYHQGITRPNHDLLECVIQDLRNLLLLKMEIGVKPFIRYVKIELGYKRSLPLTRRKAASRGLGILPAYRRRSSLRYRVALLLYGRSRGCDFPEGSDFSKTALWAASRWVNEQRTRCGSLKYQ